MSGRLRLGTSPATNPSLSSILNGTHCDARPRPPKQRSEGGIFMEEGRVQEGLFTKVQSPVVSGPWASAPAITRCCASDSGSPSLTGRCQDVSDRVGTWRCRGRLPVGTHFKRAGVYHNLWPRKICVQKAVIVPTYNHAVTKGPCEICNKFTCT